MEEKDLSDVLVLTHRKGPGGKNSKKGGRCALLNYTMWIETFLAQGRYVKVALLMGGRSSERQISLRTGEQIASALMRKGHNVVKFDVDERIAENIVNARVDVAFIALHGRYGEDGTIQGLLEIIGVPYVGSGVLASSLAINKIMTKKILEYEGLPTPRWTCISKDRFEMIEWSRFWGDLYEKLNLPIVVKPNREGSTIGLSIARSEDEVKEGIKEAFEYDEEILFEEYVKGQEITICVLGNKEPQALPVIEIVSKTGYYDFEAKYTPGMSEHIIPARISEKAYKLAQELGVKAHKVLGCRGFSRVDGMVYGENQVTLFEVNTIPGMTETSLFPDAARHAGIEFPDLVEKLLELAMEQR